ncbi:cation-transporting P-type ATPase [Synechocystis salina]|uniref:cation-transporting P-type ATPase n=1 Tax=Synechocystis salina TaxID=945780 RepID=UPI001D132CAE
MSDPDVSVSPVKAEAWYSYGIEKTLQRLTTVPHRGLAEKTVVERRRTYGLNEIATIAGRNNWQILLDQFTNVMLLMLIGVAIISGVLDLLSLRLEQSQTEGLPFKDTIAIFAIVILNGLLGYFQESRAEKALAALKKMASPKVQVVRDAIARKLKRPAWCRGTLFCWRRAVNSVPMAN